MQRHSTSTSPFPSPRQYYVCLMTLSDFSSHEQADDAELPWQQLPDLAAAANSDERQAAGTLPVRPPPRSHPSLAELLHHRTGRTAPVERAREEQVPRPGPGGRPPQAGQQPPGQHQRHGPCSGQRIHSRRSLALDQRPAGPVQAGAAARRRGDLHGAIARGRTVTGLDHAEKHSGGQAQEFEQGANN